MQKKKTYTFQYVCQRCGRAFFLARPRPGNRYFCDDCRVIVAREKTRERVRRYRQRKEFASPVSEYARFLARWVAFSGAGRSVL